MPADDTGSDVDDYNAKPSSSKETNIGAFLREYNSKERDRARHEQGPVAQPKKFGSQISLYDPELEAFLGSEV